MREIKFRGKGINTGEWVFGFYTQGSFIDPNTGKETIRHIIDNDMLHDVVPETIGQFTGLKDKNGKEIYEGDVLKSRSIIHFVEYKEDEGVFVGRFKLGARVPNVTMQQPDFTSLHQWWINKYEKEVVGNIYDNPKLFKQNYVHLCP